MKKREEAKRALRKLEIRDQGLLPGDLRIRQEVAKCEAAEGRHEGRIYKTQLLQQPPGTCGNLTGSWIAVLLGAATDHVRDEHVGPPDPGAFEHQIEQSPRRADEGYPLSIFGCSWRFTDEEDVRSLIAGPWNHARSVQREGAAGAADHHRVE